VPDLDNSPSLFCFTLVRPDSYEVLLIRTLFPKGAGIFGCNFWTVFSDRDIMLGMQDGQRVGTNIIEGGIKSKRGGVYDTALNTEVFVRVWEAVFKQEKFWSGEWTVKLDPDAVFLPVRLRQHLARANPYDPVWLNNCKYGNHGPIEVISKAGMAVFSAGIGRCKKSLKHEFRLYGEDVFERHCLKHLSVHMDNDFGLLSEKHCDENPSPCLSGQVVFHPFKSPRTYFECLSQAMGLPWKSLNTTI